MLYLLTLMGLAASTVFVASDEDDEIIGTDEDDSIRAGGGDDEIMALLGNDSVAGEAGDDTLDGAQGDDALSGGPGSDYILGGAGADDLSGGAGDDLLDGGPGDDTIDAGPGNDGGNAGDGDDLVWLMEGANIFEGGAGADRVHTGPGDDTVHGYQFGAQGVDGGDLIFGAGGNDLLFGGEGGDSLSGGEGADLLDGYLDNDSLDGGAGDDEILGGEGNDTILGGGGHDVIEAGSEDDSVDAGDGNDWVTGGKGNDTILLGDGDDVLIADEGDDTAEGGAGNDYLTGEAGNDTLSGGSGTDTLVGGAGEDLLINAGERAFDRDLLQGGEGNDILHNEGGRSVSLEGGAGQDLLISDDIWGRLFGGAEADIFAPSLSAAAGLIYPWPTLHSAGDFEPGVDKIVIRIEQAPEGAEFGFLVENGTTTLVQFTPEGPTEYNGILALEGVALEDASMEDVLFLTDAEFTALIGSQSAEGFELEAGGGDTGGGDSVLFSEGDDNVTLSEGTDSVSALAGNDTILALDGDDTVFGDDGNDVIDDGEGNDSLIGGAGNDTLLSSFGTDTLVGGAGDDVLDALVSEFGAVDQFFGGDGNDTLSADLSVQSGAGLIQLDGGTGDDLILLERAGASTVLGGAGNDTLSLSGVGAGEIDAGDGNDVVDAAGIFSSPFASLDLGAGDDLATVTSFGPATITAGDGNDTVASAGAGSGNLLLGGAGDDSLSSLNGSDTLIGGEGENTLIGNGGDDLLIHSGGAGLLSGGTGSDTFVLYSPDPGHLGTIASFENDEGTRFGNEFDRLVIALPSDITPDRVTAALSPFEGTEPVTLTLLVDGAPYQTVTFSSGSLDIANSPISLISPADLAAAENGTWEDVDLSTEIFATTNTGTVLGTNGPDALLGTEGDDTLDGLSGSDTLSGLDGDDLLISGDGSFADRNDLFGGPGDDTLQSGSGVNLLDGGDGNDSLSATTGFDTLDGGAGQNTYDGSRFQDLILDNGPNGKINAAEGNDTIVDARIEDALDLTDINAGDGDDLILTNASGDIFGGAGADTFIVDLSTGPDRLELQDFDPTVDSLVVALPSGVDPSAVMAAYAPGTLPIGSEITLTSPGGFLGAFELAPRADGSPVDPSQINIALIAPEDLSALESGTWSGVDLTQTTQVIGPEGPSSGTPTEGDDILIGTPGADIIEAEGGNDLIDGAAGNDTLNGGDGNDTIEGGAGVNLMIGGAGEDVLSAVPGGTTIFGAQSQYFGGSGNDILINNGISSVALNGDEGDDILISRGPGGLFFSGDGADVYIANSNPDTPGWARFSDITVTEDIILVPLYPGQTEDDFQVRRSAGGADYLEIADPSETNGYRSIALLDGPGGLASFPLYRIFFAPLEDVEAFIASQGPDGPDPSLIGFDPNEPQAPISTDGNDLVIGGFDDDVLFGNGGNDSILGLRGNDLLDGGIGGDTLRGGEGGDILRGGDDTEIGQIDIRDSFPNPIPYTSSNDRLIGEGGNDTLAASINNTAIFGGTGDDLILGAEAGYQAFQGNEGNDTLVGLSGDSVEAPASDAVFISGMRGNDGDDVLVEGDGYRLWGNDGADTFIDLPDRSGVIYQFEADDTLLIVLPEGAALPGDDQITFQATYGQNDGTIGRATLEIAVNDGTGGVHSTVTLTAWEGPLTGTATPPGFATEQVIENPFAPDQLQLVSAAQAAALMGEEAAIHAGLAPASPEAG